MPSKYSYLLFVFEISHLNLKLLNMEPFDLPIQAMWTIMGIFTTTYHLLLF